MNSAFLKLFCLALVTGFAFATVTYRIQAEYPGATQGQFIISGETGEWTIELVWDDKVKVNVSQHFNKLPGFNFILFRS